jgi:DNA-binding transcriptional ArsR family regulator
MSSLDDAVAAARALANPARLRMLAMLRSGELCVCQLTAVLGLAPSTVSAHLRELKLAGLVAERKDGRYVHVRLAPAGAATAWIECALAHTVRSAQAVADETAVAALRRLPVDELCRLGADEVRAVLAGCRDPEPEKDHTS